ncbi:unnamed protein product [Caenorhabditis angaria]|uniref:Uncharacterized protein n=1 Tax=Caenorhabditis angaria TaxID=860376 RepID=A0A9P1INB9_9PELO|nr:unnamed protein product [Caenorhabditis angaria]
MIDFTVPEYLINYYHTLGILSIIFNSYGLYLVVFKNSKIDTFRYYLLGFQLSCTFSDIFLTFGMQPVLLFPICSGFSNGYLSSGLSVCLGSIAAQNKSLCLCFIRKHQAIAKISTTQIIPNLIFKLIVALFIIFPFTIGAYFYLCGLSKDEQYAYITKNYPYYLENFKNLREFHVGVPNRSLVGFFIYILIGENISVSITIYTTIQMFRILREHRHRLSNENYNKHRNAIISLLVQFAVSSMTILPPIELTISFWMEFENIQTYANISIMILSTHSVINIIVTVATFPAYRKATKQLFCRKKKVESIIQRQITVSAKVG